ncbi:MAG: hypothetical protein GY743_01480 [Planctomycetaceae bacterium]|nr:hypothetical protein [Planctomycetaceae bacterium]
MNEEEIVYLETRMDRFHGRWQAMSRIARMGIVASLFSAIGLLTCGFQAWIPFLSMPFSVIGLLIGLTAFLAGLYHNLRRDGFWFPLLGVVLGMLGLSIALAGWFGVLESRKQELRLQQQKAFAEMRQQFLGSWLKNDDDVRHAMEFTESGSLLWTGNADPGGQAKQAVAKFDIRKSVLVVSLNNWEAQNNRALIRYTVDWSQQNELLLGQRRLIFGETEFDLSGVWKRKSKPRELTKLEQEIAGYQKTLASLIMQERRIATLSTKFEESRQQLLTDLQPYADGKSPDDQWNVWAQELASLREQLDYLQSRQPKLKQAIIRLEAAIDRKMRKVKLDEVRIDHQQLAELILTTERLDEELKILKQQPSVEEVILQQTVDREMQQKSSQTDAGGKVP